MNKLNFGYLLEIRVIVYKFMWKVIQQKWYMIMVWDNMVKI
jgi:hypothetical protein